MSISQAHGVKFENEVKKSGVFPGARRFIDQNHLLHDLPAECDPEGRGMPISIKAARKGGGIGLADALRFWTMMRDTGTLLVLGRYEQTAKTKRFDEIHTFRLQGDAIVDQLLGDVEIHEVRRIRELITLRNFPVGEEDEARIEADALLEKIEARKKRQGKSMGLVTLNKKVGSTNERRLQCSLTQKRLFDLFEDLGFLGNPDWHQVHREAFGTRTLPWAPHSTERENAAGSAQVLRFPLRPAAHPLAIAAE